MRDLLTKDLGWKIFSLLLAAAIWLTVNRILHEAVIASAGGSGNPVTYGNLPVTLVSSAADVRAFHVAPMTVKVTVTGPAAVMSTLQADQLHATATVSGASLTRGQLVSVDISLPPRVAIVSIEPDKVLVIVPNPPDKKP
jgi:YbbR domain-containing protein